VSRSFAQNGKPIWWRTAIGRNANMDPRGGLCDSEIMLLLVLYHSSRFKNFKTFYNGIVLGLLRAYFPGAPCYEALINGRNIAETIIGHIKEFSSLRLPKHRSVFNAFTHITAAIVAYQIDPLLPTPVCVFIPLPNP
jgi:hypothetical protein